MHLDPARLVVEVGPVSKGVQVECGVELPVEPCKHVQVEGRRHAFRVVVRCAQDLDVLAAVHAEDERALRADRRADPVQECRRFRRVQVADGRAGEERNAAGIGRQGRQREARGVVRADRRHAKVRILAGPFRRDGRQLFHRDVDRDVRGRIAQRIEQGEHLHAGAAAVLDQRRVLAA